ncbi:unnamed protein product [Thlaspi arvense]|uniref:Uncharacterized protein n=1 Tax=Thlaspi arvense TaxID=13288 RepID=A0AAU9RQQ7_THLAR|nr:unnamed protein product [Thlaspi arvense]
MPYYSKDDDEVDDFTEYDPTPYSGGYDIAVTYGRSIPPSDETCYPLSSRSGDAFEYQRPVFSSNHDPSAYGDQALNTEYSSYARPKTRPGGQGGAHVEGEHGGRKPEHGGSGSDFGRKPNSGYGGRTEVEYGRKPESGYGGRTEVEYGRKPESEHGSGYGGRMKSKEEEDGDSRKPSYGHDDDDKKESHGYKKHVSLIGL